MLKLLADENLDGDIIRGLFRHRPGIDLVRVQDIGLSGADDPTVLEWAATESRIVITHDIRTMPVFAYARVRQAIPMPGIFIVNQSLSVRAALENILVLVDASATGEWEHQVVYLPL